MIERSRVSLAQFGCCLALNAAIDKDVTTTKKTPRKVFFFFLVHHSVAVSSLRVIFDHLAGASSLGSAICEGGGGGGGAVTQLWQPSGTCDG